MTSRPGLRPTAGFPLFATGFAKEPSALSPGTILLDGMEVEFERTVGFYPVVLEPKRHASADTPTEPD